MSMLDFFTDWQNKSCTFYKKTVTKNSSGEPVEAWVSINLSGTYNFWTDNSRQTDQADKYFDKATGKILVPSGNGIDLNEFEHKFISGGVDYLITGVNDIAAFNDFDKFSWVKDMP